MKKSSLGLITKKIIEKIGKRKILLWRNFTKIFKKIKYFHFLNSDVDAKAFCLKKTPRLQIFLEFSWRKFENFSSNNLKRKISRNSHLEKFKFFL